ncbi:Hypp1559 [Branchiostoma lanceolatum]|uniref:Hypp1559 protein n=1 Tax=Branchiostoma lanceolatum TaxID=7740 RepID=A0A8J9ZIY3_BRALA|nr:Hypp1559 [Branchiostoma lanceolatum]
MNLPRMASPISYRVDFPAWLAPAGQRSRVFVTVLGSKGTDGKTCAGWKVPMGTQQERVVALWRREFGGMWNALLFAVEPSNSLGNLSLVMVAI